MSSLASEQVSIEHQLNQLRSRKDMLTQNSYPGDCTRVCGLRATLEASVRDIDLRCGELESRLEIILKEIKHNTEQLDKNQSILQNIAPAIPVMKSLWDKLSSNYLIDLALDGESFVECLNTHCGDIVNRIVRGLESSKLYYTYKDLYDRSVSIKNSLSMMKTADSVQMSVDVVNEMIRDREEKLNSGISVLDTLDSSILEKSSRMKDICSMSKILSDMNSTISNANKACNSKLVQCRIDFDKQLISEHNNVRNVLSEKLREVEHTLSEQSKIIDILDSEIRPTLEDLRKQKLNWEAVESGLSPTKGLPCIYLIRFINRIMSRANALIQEVWYCDMELEYLEEKESLDFTIGMILNKSTAVKDISLGSKGQQAIIDLTTTLGFAIERGLLSKTTVKFDESDAQLTESHRVKLIELLSRMIDDGSIKQMLLVNHYAAQTGISQCDCVCLSTDGVLLPNEYNKWANITAVSGP